MNSKENHSDAHNGFFKGALASGAAKLAVAEAIAVLITVALPPDETACYFHNKAIPVHTMAFLMKKQTWCRQHANHHVAGACCRLGEATAAA